MTRLIFSKVIITFSICFLFTSSTNAAILYIDPSTGSLLFQILSAIVLAILFYLSLIKKNIKRLFSKVKNLLFK